MKNNINPLIGIVGGRGKMGSWFREFFEEKGYEVLVSGSNTKISNIELAQKADIVIISVPIRKTIQVIKEVRGWVRKDALFCDFTSLKKEQIEAMKEADSGVLGMHPLFGPLTRTLEGQKIVFCLVKANPWIDFLAKIFTENGAEIVEMSPEEHDLQMAGVQALVHFVNIGLARTFSSQNFAPKALFLTPTFRLQSLIIGRILEADPKLYADIEMENPYFEDVLVNFNKEIDKLTKSVKDKDFEGFAKEFKSASLFYSSKFKKETQIELKEIIAMIERQSAKPELASKKINSSKTIKVGFLGPRGTFSHQAAMKIENSTLFPLLTIKEIFEKVNLGEIDFGVVPAENSIGGKVFETIDCLVNYPLKVSGSFSIDIHHCLLTRTLDQNKIKVVITHPQALHQCKDWLDKNLPKVERKADSSTIAPIVNTIDKSIAFIGPEVAAKIYDLHILAKNIEKTQNNLTKFYLISQNQSREFQEKLESKKSLILLEVYDKVGILRDILDVFAVNNLNLTSLHSIPNSSRPFSYFFLIEIDAALISKRVVRALEEIKEFCSTIKILGETS